MERFFGNRRITLYASGTAALAQAIIQSAATRPISSPEVIIPAYGCPDLVAACLFAGVIPRLVDVAPTHWAYDLRALESSLTPNTVAVVAVNLLGLGDGAAQLLPICRERRIALIQDSAQFLPREPIEWPGDYVILSFGRGKPLNLLHGGALVEPPGESHPQLIPPQHYTGRSRLLRSRAAAIAFNVLTRPHAYRIFSALPGTGLGEVTYKPLNETALLPEDAWKQAGKAFELYRRRPSYRRDIWAAAIEEWFHLGIVPLECPDSPLPAEPLRLALLAPDRPGRDALVHRLDLTGLGASRFYGTDLPAVVGIPEMAKRQGPFPQAIALADRLFTLPTHRLVTRNVVKSACNVARVCRHPGDLTQMSP